jgi:hypothetical protein
MALSPDVIFELFLPFEPSTAQKGQIVGFVQGGLPETIQSPVPPVWNPTKKVLTVGFWIVTDGFTQEQLEASLRASSFISGTGHMTAGLFISTNYILLAAATNLKLPKRIEESVGHIILNNINIKVSSAGIVTTVFGEYDPPVLPKVVFTYTISDTLALNESPPPPLKYHESTDLQLDIIGVIENAVLLGMLDGFWGTVVFFTGLFGAGLFDPHAKGAGAQLANGWPSTVLTPTSPPPLSGKLVFTWGPPWGQLNVDNSGVRTVGTWSFDVRSPQVQIVGPTDLSFNESQPGVMGRYTVSLTDFRDVKTVVWGGDAAGGDITTTVQFDNGGDFTITAQVTDVDNVSATGATNVTVTETSDDRG